jgi:tellurite resistance protein TehA-like permease
VKPTLGSSRWVTVPPPAAGAIVMAAGIESVVLRSAGERALSEVLLWVGVAVWVTLGVLVAMSVLRHREALRARAASPAALTAVAGTSVLGTRMVGEGWTAAGAASLVLASVVWLALQRPVWRSWRTPVSGAAFMVTVSAEALAVLCAALATGARLPWLVAAGTILAVIGVGFYPVVASRFRADELLTGCGDQWVAGGALAIAALAFAELASAAHVVASAAWIARGLRITSTVVLGAAAAWLPLLIAAELRRPRLRYDLGRWATVFPVAMYSAAATAVARLDGSSALLKVSHWWAWMAFGLWVVVSAAMLRPALSLRARRPMRGGAAG